MNNSTESTIDDPLTHDIIGAAIDVHRLLGPGLLESTYEICLVHELKLRGRTVDRQVALPFVTRESTSTSVTGST